MGKVTIDELASMVQKGFTIMDGKFDHLDQKVEDVRTELKQEIQGVRTELREEIQGVRTELKEEIQGVRAELGAEIHSARADIHRLESSVDDVKSEVKKIAKRSLEDSDALVKNFITLEKRVCILEKNPA